jgi:ribosomal protein S18 acetylase RimI-like enzyme
MNINYKIADIADINLVLELVKEFHQHEKLAFDEKVDYDAIANFITNNSLGQLWLIQQENQVIGYLILTFGYSLEFRGRDAFIDEFYLRPQYRQQGVGTQTLSFAEDACRVLGVKAIHLEVDFENPDAQRLYDRIGYQRHHRFLMTKELI